MPENGKEVADQIMHGEAAAAAGSDTCSGLVQNLHHPSSSAKQQRHVGGDRFDGDQSRAVAARPSPSLSLKWRRLELGHGRRWLWQVVGDCCWVVVILAHIINASRAS